jgi:hypothetical protein
MLVKEVRRKPQPAGLVTWLAGRTSGRLERFPASRRPRVEARTIQGLQRKMAHQDVSPGRPLVSDTGPKAEHLAGSGKDGERENPTLPAVFLVGAAGIEHPC